MKLASAKSIYACACTALLAAALPTTSQALTCKFLQTNSSNFDAGVTSSADGTVNIFNVDINGALHRYHGPALFLNLTHEALGGVATSEPSAVSWGPGHSAVFVRGSDTHLWYLQWDGASATGWQSLGGGVTWNPYPVSTAPGNILAFYRGTNKQLWYRELSGGAWGPHQSLAGVLTSSPVAVSWGPGHVAVFTRGQANDLWYRQRIGSTWGPWVGLGGSFATDPAVVSRGAGLIDVFVRWTNSTVAKISYNGASWSAWQTLNAPPNGAVSEPAAVANPGQLIAFVRGGTFSFPPVRPIWRNTSSDGGQTWSGWVEVLPFLEPSANNPEAVSVGPFGGWTFAATNFPSGAPWGELAACTGP